MATFFGNNFSEDRWRKAALKNAYSLLSKQRFEHAVAFFLLADSLWDAVRLCISHLKDVQLGLVIARLYDSHAESSTYKRVLSEYVLGQDELSCEAEKGTSWSNGQNEHEHIKMNIHFLFRSIFTKHSLLDNKEIPQSIAHAVTRTRFWRR
jgi:hypothetical protein